MKVSVTIRLSSPIRTIAIPLNSVCKVKTKRVASFVEWLGYFTDLEMNSKRLDLCL